MSHDHNHSQDNTQLDPIQQRMDQLLDQSIQKALMLIREHGEFYPFGVTRVENGDFTLVQAKMDTDTPTSNQVAEKLFAGLKQDASRNLFTSAAVVSDVRLRDPQTQRVSDAIRVHLEDAQGEPIIFFLPYVNEGHRITTSDILAEHAPSLIFDNV
jgi:hypothetical protein